MAVPDDVARASAAVETATVRHEQVAHRVEIQAPLIAAAVSEDFEFVPHGMIAPHASAQFLPLRIRGAGLADQRVREHALAPIEPTVHAPRETVECLVRVLKAPPIEQHLRSTIGTIVTIAIGNEQQMRGGADPDAAETNFQAADQIQALDKRLLDFEPAIAIGVFQNNNAILALTFRLFVRVTERFGHPDASAVVERHGDGLVDVGFCRDELGLEAVG